MVTDNKTINTICPSYCCIALLESCFMGCKMCYKWKTDIALRSPEEPKAEQWKLFISDLSRMSREKMRINFAGGEPLARNETIELIAYAASLGFDTHLATNGFMIDKGIAADIAKTGLTSIAISVDGVNPATHDLLRGKEGAFDRAMNAIALLREYSPGMEINLCTIICELNLAEVVDLAVMASDNGRINGIGYQAVTQPFSTPEKERWYDSEEYSFLWPKDREKVNSVMDELTALGASGRLAKGFMIKNPVNQFQVYKRYFSNPEDFLKIKQCHLDRQAINVTPDGDIHLCFYKPSIGNIKKSGISEIWNSEKAESVRGQIRQCRKNCQAMVNCNFDEKEEYAV